MRGDGGRLKAFAEILIANLGDIEVSKSRSGLVMLPMRDTARGVAFQLGEVLVSEAHVRQDSIDGYGMRQGHDLEASMAMALVDLALARNVRTYDCAAFCEREANSLN